MLHVMQLLNTIQTAIEWDIKWILLKAYLAAIE